MDDLPNQTAEALVLLLLGIDYFLKSWLLLGANRVFVWRIVFGESSRYWLARSYLEFQNLSSVGEISVLHRLQLGNFRVKMRSSWELFVNFADLLAAFT